MYFPVKHTFRSGEFQPADFPCAHSLKIKKLKVRNWFAFKKNPSKKKYTLFFHNNILKIDLRLRFWREYNFAC